MQQFFFLFRLEWRTTNLKNINHSFTTKCQTPSRYQLFAPQKKICLLRRVWVVFTKKITFMIPKYNFNMWFQKMNFFSVVIKQKHQLLLFKSKFWKNRNRVIMILSETFFINQEMPPVSICNSYLKIWQKYTAENLSRICNCKYSFHYKYFETLNGTQKHHERVKYRLQQANVYYQNG